MITKHGAKQKEAKQWALNNLDGRMVFQRDIDDHIKINRNGILHGIYAKSSPVKVQALYELVSLIKRSTLCAVEPDRKGRKDILLVYKFVTNWKFALTDYLVYIVARRTKDGLFYYDHATIKKRP